jgi:hypothetical protein
MAFVANEHQKLPVRSTYQCPACQYTVRTTNYVLTVVYAFGRLLRLGLEVLKSFGGGG